ncbi:MAG TPA: YMGG-like glycine zipper-containing protein, partial [Pyrinomonadaceae bacterium]|nr:YMGG-like glycine zipper-containing protein [Pyrinomonadaceae bacterium]
EFETATDQLRANFNSRNAAAADVQRVLDQGARINNFLSRNALTPRVQNDWATVRTDLDALANAYNVSWDWQNTRGGIPPVGGGLGTAYGMDARLTGTFRLDPARSDNARTIAQNATRGLPYNERQRVYDALVARLESPDMLAIERRGSNVTIASSRAPQTTFEADGRERTETLPNGVVARVAASLAGDALTVSSQGYRENDFSVTFDPDDNGRTLTVTRRIYSERLTQPVVVQNTYDRVADIAQWNSVGGGGSLGYPSNTTASGEFIIRDGETLVATLDNNLTTRDSKDGDRFTMTVRSPVQYEGAIIDGTVRGVERGGRITGRSGMALNFDTIRLRNGQTYRFAGFIDSVRTANGETVRVDNEGSVQDNESRGNTTAQRAAIGTAVGAIIGAIAGGGKGAAIGAVLGAGAGAGSVYVQGRDELELLSGTEVTVRASAPNNIR